MSGSWAVTRIVVALALCLGQCLPVYPEHGQGFKLRPEGGTVHQVRFLRAIDGDTVEVEVYYTIRVRLLDCWAPENHRTNVPGEKERGIASKANLESYAKPGDTGVVFVPAGVDHSDALSLNRHLGWAWLDDYHESINEIQVRDGHAKVSK